MTIAPTQQEIDENGAAANNSNLAARLEEMFPGSLATHDGSTDEIRNQVAGLAAGLSQNINPNTSLPTDGHYGNVAASHVDMNANIQHAYDFLAHHCNGHWTEAQAMGIVANLIHESGCNPHGPAGDGGQAMGLCQWHADRRTEFERHFHKSFKDSSFDDQLAFIDYEMTEGKEWEAGNKLKEKTDPRDAAAAVSTYYERPADKAGNAVARARTAAGLVSKLENKETTPSPKDNPEHELVVSEAAPDKSREADPRVPTKATNSAYDLLKPHVPDNVPSPASIANASDAPHLPDYNGALKVNAAKEKPNSEPAKTVASSKASNSPIAVT